MKLFKENFSLYERKKESERVLKKYPERIPVICEKNIISKNTTTLLDKNKYLVPHDLTIGQFIYIIRKIMCLHPDEAIFLFVNGTIPPTGTTMINIYKLHQDNDGFLYFTYAFENVFG